MNFEIEMDDLEERFRIRTTVADDLNRSLAEQDLAEVRQMRQNWIALGHEADEIEVQIQRTKKRFASETQNQVHLLILRPFDAVLSDASFRGRNATLLECVQKQNGFL